MSKTQHDQPLRQREPVRIIAADDWRVELLPSVPYEARYTATTPIIGFSFDMQSGVHAFASDRRHPFRARTNGLAYLPEGCDVYSMSPHGGEYLRLVGPAVRRKARTAVERFSDVIDATAILAAQELRRAILTPGPADILRCEELAQTLAARAACHLGFRASPPRSSDWMTPYRLRRIDEIIEARLAKKLTVAELAATLGLSTGFFARAFKSTMGRSPQDHIIHQRLRHARALLHSTDDTLAAIATACGFASHAHMTVHFRRRLDTTPSHLRSATKIRSRCPTRS